MARCDKLVYPGRKDSVGVSLRAQGQDALRTQYTPQWQQQYQNPDISGYSQALSGQYDIAKQRLGETFDVQSKSLEEYMNRRGIFYSGAHDRERRNLEEFRTEELNAMASQIAYQNYQEKQRKQMEAYAMLFPEDTAQNALGASGAIMQGTQAGFGNALGYMGQQQDWRTALLASRTSTENARLAREAASSGQLWGGIGTALGAFGLGKLFPS